MKLSNFIKIKKLDFNNNKPLNCLVYYVTDGYNIFNHIFNHNHGNINLVFSMINVLKKDFNITLIDRSYINFNKIEDKYHLFIGIGLGGSGKNYKYLCNKLNSSIKVLLTTSETPKDYNIQGEERFKNYPLLRRRKLNKDAENNINISDYLLTLGTEDLKNRYENYYDKKCFPLINFPSYNIDYLTDSINKNDYLFFNGNGNLHKGLNIALKSCSIMNKKLYICSNIDKDFKNIFKKELKNHNIKGYINKNSNFLKKFSFNILISCSEAMPTSLLETSRIGIISICSKYSNFPKDIFHFEANNEIDLCNVIKYIDTLDNEEILNIKKIVYNDSLKYNSELFEEQLSIFTKFIIEEIGVLV